MKKKYLSLFMSVILAVSSVVAFSGCGNADKGNKTDGQNTESSDEQVTLRFMEGTEKHKFFKFYS